MLQKKILLGGGDTLLLASFEYFRETIMALQRKAMHEEAVLGESNKFCRIQYLHLVSYWHLLAYLRIIDNTSYEDTKELLNFDKVRECIVCQGISWKELDGIWNLERVSGEGISHSNIDGNFQVGFPENLELEFADIKALLEEKEGCCPVDNSSVDILATQAPEPISTQFGAYILI